MTSSFFRSTLLFAAALIVISCRGEKFEQQPVHPNMNMDQQERFEAQEENSFFADNRSMRMPVEGTVARGHLREDKAYYQGINEDSSFVENIPVDVTKSFLKRGQKQYNIYCTPCHGLTGDGQGIIMTGGYGYVPAPTYHQDRIRNMPDGELYSTIANGIRNMPSYAHQVEVRDRWAIVSYIRALQRSQYVPENEMQKYDVNLASLRQDYQEAQEKEMAKQEAQATASGGGEITAARGKQIYEQNACQTCHSRDGSDGIGPSHQNIFGKEEKLADGSTITVDEEYLRESITNPNAKIVAGFDPVMAPYSFLSDDEIQSLIEYLKSISDAAPAENGESGTQEGAAEESEGTSAADTAKDQQQTTGATTPESADSTETLSATARQGKDLFQSFECTSCHFLDGSNELAPVLKGLFGSNRELEDGSTITADEGYIKESIQYPGAKIALGYNNNMPSYRDLMTDQELQAITDYIKILR